MRFARAVTALIVSTCGGGALGVSGCMSADPEITYDAYAGPPAYPDKRSKLPSPKGYFGYVSNRGSDSITVLDLPTNDVVAEVFVGREPVGTGGPHHLAVDSAGFVYVTLSYPKTDVLPGPHAAHFSDVRPGVLLKLAANDLHRIGAVQVDAFPGEVALAPDGSRVVVTHFDVERAANASLAPAARRALLISVEPSKLALEGTPASTVYLCRAPNGAAIAADSKTAFVACYGDDAIAVLDLTSPEAVPSLVPVGAAGPSSLVLSRSGRYAAVGATQAKQTRVFDTQSRGMSAVRIVTQGAPQFAAWSTDETRLFIPAQAPDTLVLADATTGAVVRERAFDATCQRPHEAVLARDGATLYVVCEGDHITPSAILVLDPETLETRSRIGVGVFPDRLAFARTP